MQVTRRRVIGEVSLMRHRAGVALIHQWKTPDFFVCHYEVIRLQILALLLNQALEHLHSHLGGTETAGGGRRQLVNTVRISISTAIADLL